ncbi:Phage integrase family protein [Actinokineospora alba]|uniref:Phage integrase family protein n=1 Tax=Actinokineospora alba TaxID=504798 RepID=A0A1H0LB36_9PSEU|nr:site-specific integrase [Actinokineospora alba]TDP67262.1 phage integrase family protein [Actinokineospora alba]SDJ02338.1 Phage integrase family protein [Actinokineospora alba]SDO65469.1 Phage integrase family protein [Actinokineospora alba]
MTTHTKPPQGLEDRRGSGTPIFKRNDELLDMPVPGGPRDHWPVNAILEMLPTLPTWPSGAEHSDYRTRIASGVRAILEWLKSWPGQGWQERWVSSGADIGMDWIDVVVAADSRSLSTARASIGSGLTSLLLCQVVFPSYTFLAAFRPTGLYAHARALFRPDLFAQLEARSKELKIPRAALSQALCLISKVVLHTGRDIDELTAEDMLTFRAWAQRQRRGAGISGLGAAWGLLHGIAKLGDHTSIRDALRHGQRPTAELVSAYRIQCLPVNDALVRYLDERRPALDYSSFTSLVRILAGTFWADIERHHPGIDTLDLPRDVAAAWRDRLKTIQSKDGSSRPRKDHHLIFIHVRAFYRDLQEWALEDPSWAQWSFPNPVRKADLAGQAKAQKRRTAAMHQRVRERLPHLPVLVETAERHKAEMAALHAVAERVALGDMFIQNGSTYCRTAPKSYRSKADYRHLTPPLHVEDLTTGDVLDLDRAEHDAFWAWAAIEVLRHTGIRIEEMLETTHLGLVSYQLPDTGEIVPMLQIVPSKSNEERLLLVGPELASVLASIISRLRRDNGGTVPLTTRYDGYEHVVGPALPHLFQHKLKGWKWEVPSVSFFYRLLDKTLALTGVTTADGEPLRYRPHDFRRMFATEAVTGGLPIHIVARLLGHANINTTQAYTAVFDDDLVRTYRAFLDKRRAQRPEAEYREPTEEEWSEFQQHFQLRKLELGECGRPYGTPCKHEHACIRCPSLRLEPRARPRLIEIIASLRDRIDEARLNGWSGEVAGLTTSLNAASNKLVSLDRMIDRGPSGGPVGLGIPVIGPS